MRVDQQLQKIEQEIEAIRSAFNYNATNMDVYTSTLDFTTSKNITNWSNSNPYDPREWATLVSMFLGADGNRFDVETIIVTFNCSAGINTFANLEIDYIDTSPGWAVVTCRRIPYAGGARWIVTTQPNFSGSAPSQYQWLPTTLRFAVQSAVEGTLTARMIWQ